MNFVTIIFCFFFQTVLLVLHVPPSFAGNRVPRLHWRIVDPSKKTQICMLRKPFFSVIFLIGCINDRKIVFDVREDE